MRIIRGKKGLLYLCSSQEELGELLCSWTRLLRFRLFVDFLIITVNLAMLIGFQVCLYELVFVIVK